MLIPQYSIRWLLGATTVCALVFSAVALALRGHGWAIGVSIVVATLVVSMLIQALLFSLVWMFSEVGSRFSSDTASQTAGGPKSPFRQQPEDNAAPSPGDSPNT